MAYPLGQGAGGSASRIGLKFGVVPSAHTCNRPLPARSIEELDGMSRTGRLAPAAVSEALLAPCVRNALTWRHFVLSYETDSRKVAANQTNHNQAYVRIPSWSGTARIKARISRSKATKQPMECIQKGTVTFITLKKEVWPHSNSQEVSLEGDFRALKR
jgi:hypothetical protein